MASTLVAMASNLSFYFCYGRATMQVQLLSGLFLSLSASLKGAQRGHLAKLIENEYLSNTN